jgi:hypothetical protein
MPLSASRIARTPAERLSTLHVAVVAAHEYGVKRR